ncbi:hypothetical protein [Microcystis phage Mae-JY09]
MSYAHLMEHDAWREAALQVERHCRRDDTHGTPNARMRECPGCGMWMLPNGKTAGAGECSQCYWGTRNAQERLTSRLELQRAIANGYVRWADRPTAVVCDIPRADSTPDDAPGQLDLFGEAA